LVTGRRKKVINLKNCVMKAMVTGRRKKVINLKNCVMKAIISATLVISALVCFGKSDKEALYFLIPPAPINYLYSGSIVGMVNDEDGSVEFASVSDGSMPDGILLGEDGTLVVTDPALLVPGIYQFTVISVDEKNNISENELQLTLLEPGPINAYSSGKVYVKESLEKYQSGDILVEILDNDGPVKEVKLVKGSIPNGTRFLQQGKLKVNTPSSLVPGTYDFIVLAIDNKELGSFLALTVPISEPEKRPLLSLDSLNIDVDR